MYLIRPELKINEKYFCRYKYKILNNNSSYNRFLTIYSNQTTYNPKLVSNLIDYHLFEIKRSFTVIRDSSIAIFIDFISYTKLVTIPFNPNKNPLKDGSLTV